MTISIYLLKSTMAMIILLGMYKSLLEKEKMHHFNRCYLILSLVFSLTVPLLPIGLDFSSSRAIGHSISPDALVEYQVLSESSNELAIGDIVLLLYMIGLTFFAIKYTRNVYLLLHQAHKNKRIPYQGTTLVMLDQGVSPFTFLQYIYVNRQAYTAGKIDDKLLAHELTHALERHSWDVLLVEMIKTVLWFNPIVGLYKSAIQLNHEFLADQAVVNQYDQVKNYQYLLLETIKNKKIYLASNINFQLTQKRLQMMTKQSSKGRKITLVFSIVPILIGMMLAFGSSVQAQADKTSLELNEKDQYFTNTIVHYRAKDGKTKISSYESLPEEIKAKIPLPPPPPPPMAPNSNKKAQQQNLKPLPKGTVIHLNENGRVNIKTKGNSLTPPPPPPPTGISIPPPPPPPPAPGSPKSDVPNPQSTVNDLVPPPPPPAPPTLEQIIQEGGTVYINGRKASMKDIKKLSSKKDLIQTIDVSKSNNQKVIRIVTKQ